MAVQTTTQSNTHFMRLLERNRHFRHVVIVPEPAACAACAASPRLVKRTDLPVLPHRDCARRGGCACWYAASSRDPQP